METAFVVVLSVAMVLIPVAEVLLRKLRGQGPGLGPIVQHLSVWLGFIGALAATAAGKHLGLATTAFLRPDNPLRRVSRYLGGAVSSVTAMMLAWASYIALKDNAVSTAVLPGGIPEWWGGVIVPVAFALICLRFIWFTHGVGASWRERAVSLAACIGCALLFRFGQGHPHAFLWPGVVLIVSSFALGAPVFVAMSGLAMLLFFTASDPAPIASVPQATLQLVQNPTLPAIPLLTLAGYVMAAGGASQRLVRAYKSLFGWLPGGLALMAISVMALFTTFTGGSGVTILALGGLVFPALIKDKYPEGFSLGLVTASGSLGLLFPPSLPVILYGAVAGVAAERLFLGGLVPGLILILIVAVYAIRTGIKAHAPRQPFDAREVGRALWAAKFDIGLPVVVMGVLLSGMA
ncbi:MAG TPA: TRAP transporter large permease subunit, partial [Polyangia bacterium]